MSTRRNVLYRFYNEADELLYIGISMTPWERFRQHRTEKPWWDDIATIRKENHPSRDAVLAAEKAAIIAERPLHNIMHNGSTAHAEHDSAKRVCVLGEGQYVALGLADGRCPIGKVIQNDGEWILLGLKEFVMGYYDDTREAFRLNDVVEVAVAVEVCGRVNDEHLSTFQRRWKDKHARYAIDLMMVEWGLA